jgi:hypothetical protein
MSVLGDGGMVRFCREAPEPILIPSSLMRADGNVLIVRSQDYWNGDEVYLFAQNGLPFSISSAPEGVGCYFDSRWELAPNRTHVTGNSDQYYLEIEDDEEYFYNRGTPTTSGTYFIHRDNLDRISFYESRAAAINGRPYDRIDISSLDFGTLSISAAGDNEYNNAIAECVAEVISYNQGDVEDEVTLESICENPPFYLEPVAGENEYDNAEMSPRNWVNGFPWVIQGGLREWSLDLEASSVSITSVGQKFGESIKSIVTGGGSFDFIVDRTTEDGYYDSTALMRLLQFTEKGSKADAEFYMIQGRDETCGNIAAGDLYYECSILLTSIAISTKVDDVIVGTAQFVTTGAIELRMGL